MPDTFLPSRESELLAWTGSFRTTLLANPESFGVSLLQAGTLSDLFVSFAEGMRLTESGETRSPANIRRKNEAKQAMVAYVRLLVRLIRGTPDVTNFQKIQLGITVREAAVGAIPRPADAPGLRVESVHGRQVRLRLMNTTEPTRRGRPHGVSGAVVFTFVGEEPPKVLSAWTYAGSTGRMRMDVMFPPSALPGTKVWLTAQWFNPRKKAGPLAREISTRTMDGMSKAA